MVLTSILCKLELSNNIWWVYGAYGHFQQYFSYIVWQLIIFDVHVFATDIIIVNYVFQNSTFTHQCLKIKISETQFVTKILEPAKQQM